MPDQVSPSQPGGKKEMSMEVRLLIAFLLMGVVLFVSQYFNKPAPAIQGKSTVTPQKAEQVTKPPLPAPAAAVVSPPQAAGEPVRADKEETETIDTKLYHVIFSNRGAVIRS